MSEDEIKEIQENEKDTVVMGMCSVCKEMETTTYVDIENYGRVFICNGCSERALRDFTFICVSCGEVYHRNKKEVINSIVIPEVKKAYEALLPVQIIQGIEFCIKCSPESLTPNTSAKGNA